MDIGGAVKAMKRGRLVQPTGKAKDPAFVFWYDRAQKAVLIVETERLWWNITVEKTTREEALCGLCTKDRRVHSAVLMEASLTMREILGQWKIVPWPRSSK